MLKSWWRNLLYILEHKLNVFVECWKEGLYIQGITHDFSKFSPKEFFPYAKRFFYEGDKTLKDELHWKYAWLHHQHKNKHHWEYWVVDPKNNTALPMPKKFVIEMVCDWRSFSRKWGRKVKPSKLDLTEKIIIHPDTKKDLEMIIKRKREEDINKPTSWSNHTREL